MSRKIKLIIITMIISISLLGVTYAFFNYYKSGISQNVTSGDISLFFNEGQDSINLLNVFPETIEEARSRTDNQITFTVTGINTSLDNDIYYGIILNNGLEEDGKIRYNPEHLVFDLIEIDENGKETMVVDARRYTYVDKQMIWVNTVNRSSNETITRTYKLRMWLDENVIISDTYEDADYTTSEFKNAYGSIKISVDGDLDPKNIPLMIDSEDTYVENNNSYFYATLSNINSINQNSRSVTKDKMELNVVGTNTDIVFSYKDSKGNVVEETSESLNLSYDLAPNESVEIQIFVIPKNDANGVTDINLKASKNDIEIQNFLKRMNVYGNNFCLNNGLNKLYDCILASDSLTTNIETAKVNIENKGEVNLNDTAPSYTYLEQETLNVSNAYNITGQKFYFSDNYEFNATDGTFKLVNDDGSSVITDTLSNNYANYYTCGGTSNVGKDACGIIYRVKETSVDGTKYTITLSDRITYKIASSIRSEVGLYKTQDDYGDSYFYRGDVSNNNVYFGGYYWKIIRTNGDNSIRLIYNGETSDATAYKTTINNKTYRYSVDMPETGGVYESRYADPTYVGYMYGKNFERQTSPETTFGNIGALQSYYFADDFEFDEEKEIFRIKTKELAPISKTFSEMNETDEETGKKLYELYPYTCRATTAEGACDVVLQVNSIVDETHAKVIYHSYSSVDRDGTRTNENSSQVKTVLEEWYEKNIVNKTDEDGNLITDYIVDGTFCNDRSTPNETYSSGYLLNKHTFYRYYTNFIQATNKTATLKCTVDATGNSDKRDWFSYTEERGNGKLSYPVALITADEVAYAGGKYNTKNENFYLRNNAYYWTMSPSLFYSSNAYASVASVYSSGALRNTNVANSYGVRAVINLSSDVLISQGDGSIDNPFRLSLS